MHRDPSSPKKRAPLDDRRLGDVLQRRNEGRGITGIANAPLFLFKCLVILNSGVLFAGMKDLASRAKDERCSGDHLNQTPPFHNFLTGVCLSFWYFPNASGSFVVQKSGLLPEALGTGWVTDDRGVLQRRKQQDCITEIFDAPLLLINRIVILNVVPVFCGT